MTKMAISHYCKKDSGAEGIALTLVKPVDMAMLDDVLAARSEKIEVESKK